MEEYRELLSRSALYGAPSRVPAAVDSNAARYQHSLLAHSTGAPLATLRPAAAAAPAAPAPRPATYSVLGRYAGAPAVSSSSSSFSALSSLSRLQASGAASSRSAATSLPTAAARAEAGADSRFGAPAPAPAGLPSRLPTPAAPAPALRPPSQQPAYSAANYFLSRDRKEEEEEEEEYEEDDAELPSSGSVFLASPPPQQLPPRAPLGAAAARTALESQLDRQVRPAAAAGYGAGYGAGASYAAGSAQQAQHRSAPGPALASAASSSSSSSSSGSSSGYSSRSSSVGAASAAAAAAAPGATTAGLQNLGNTCYMNSTLQCLVHIAPLAAFFSASDWQAELAPVASPRARLVHSLAVSFARLLADLRAAPGRYVTPTELRRLAGSALSEDHLFSGSAQNDAHELLRFFLDALREALNRCRGRPVYRELAEDPRAPDAVLAERYWRSYQERDSSVVGDIFRGQLRSVMTCGTCGYSSRSFEPFEELMLQLGRGGQAAGRGGGGGGGEEPTRIEALLEAFVQPETLSGEEAWRCEACKCPRASTKRIAIFKAPPVLILVLKRFSYTRLRRCKVETPVCIAPREPRAGLQLGAYMCDTSEDARGAVYDLVGCINHSGGTFGGHYTADARAGARGWYNFNDAHANAIGDVGANGQARKEPYVLFYEKRK